jgi:16S rRNA G1207 methylase RsmC
MQEMSDSVSLQAARVVVINPGQGHIAVLAYKLTQPGQIVLAARDLLSLRMANANLTANGGAASDIDLLHRVDIGDLTEAADLFVGVLREDEGIDANVATVRQCAAALAENGRLLLAATSTTAARLTKRLRADRALRIVERRRKHGQVVLRLTRN